METRNERLVPYKATHPGEILFEELKERGISQKAFAATIGVQPSNLNEVIKGHRNINEDWAIKFEKALGIPYDFWMNLQHSYIYNSRILSQRQQKESLEFETLTSRVPSQLKAQIAQLAAKGGLSVSAFIRQTMEKTVASLL
ncbi:MAG: HigA family addiction module antidote protein [Bacteroidales bacterium]|nr:HigA family addiction module antidote protein [Bacteroidales bacterium]